jgi:hypothetical protein
MNSAEYNKIAKGAVIAMGGALLTYLSSAITTMDFGQYTGVVVATFSILINAGLKYIDSTKGATVSLHEKYNDETDQ